MIKIALLSFADIHNYGDTFFPVVMEKEISKRMDCEIDFITNKSVTINSFFYQKKTQVYSIQEIVKYDAVILVGGEVIHQQDEQIWNPIYKKLTKGHYSGTPSKIVFDWINSDIKFKAWFAVGVLPIQPKTWPSIISALENLDHISVRGLLSKKIIENEYIANNLKISICPDIGWIFVKDVKNSKEILKKISEKNNLDELLFNPYCIFQCHESTNPPIEYLSQCLVKHQETYNIPVLLLSIIRPWNDYKVLSAIAKTSQNKLRMLPLDLSIYEIGSLLFNASYFCGSSMHGAVSAMSCGKPSANIHPWQASKLQDLHAMTFRPELFINEWNDIPNMMRFLHNDPENLKGHFTRYTEQMQKTLELRIDRLCENIIKKVR